VFVGAGDGEPAGGEHGQGDVGVPGSPAADLVVVEPGFVLGGLEAFLDSPAGPGDPDQLAQRGGGGTGAAKYGAWWAANQARRPGFCPNASSAVNHPCNTPSAWRRSSIRTASCFEDNLKRLTTGPATGQVRAARTPAPHADHP
jgi:hypothetical protein